MICSLKQKNCWKLERKSVKISDTTIITSILHIFSRIFKLIAGSILQKFYFTEQLILSSMNLLFFVLTALKIRSLQMDMNKMMAQNESSKHQSRLQSEKEKYVNIYRMHYINCIFFFQKIISLLFFWYSSFVLFLRLVIVMGVVWIMESISFFVDISTIYFFIFDVWNCLQGVLIFVFMVCKRRVFRLIKKRFVLN